MIQTALLPHIIAGFRVGMATTLNHCMWIHKHNFRIDEWMLYENDSPTAGAGRAMIYGRLWTRDGQLVMTTAQEACIRSKL
jgi:acyl-CoA thioesterase II